MWGRAGFIFSHWRSHATESRADQKVTAARAPARVDSRVADFGPLVAGEILQLQRLLREEGHGQVEVVVPQLRASKKQTKQSRCEAERQKEDLYKQQAGGGLNKHSDIDSFVKVPRSSSLTCSSKLV